MLTGIDQFIESIDHAQSVESIKSALCIHLNLLGFERFGYQLLRTPEGERSGSAETTKPVFFLTNYPPEWTKEYNAARYISDDMVVRHAARTTKPFTWSDIGDFRQFTERQKEVFEKAATYGLISGGSIPITGPDHARALFAIASSLDEKAFAQHFLQNRYELQLIANYAHMKLLYLQFYHAPQSYPMLSPRELEVMTWLARGKNQGDISVLTGIKPPTVKKHSISAFRKLGTYNAAHAIAIAVNCGLILP